MGEAATPGEGRGGREECAAEGWALVAAAAGRGGPGQPLWRGAGPGRRRPGGGFGWWRWVAGVAAVEAVAVEPAAGPAIAPR